MGGSLLLLEHSVVCIAQDIDSTYPDVENDGGAIPAGGSQELPIRREL